MLAKKAIVEAGSATIWNDLHTFIKNSDLSINANFEYVDSQVDLEEFANYYIIEIYAYNIDWLDNNIRYWRAYENGQWRWVLYDLDWGIAKSKVSVNNLSIVLITTDPNEQYNAVVFQKLMANTEFRNDFVQRFASHINITYDPTRTNAIIDGFVTEVQSELPAHITRWGELTSTTAWINAINNNARYFYNNRPSLMRGFLNSYLGSPGTANLTVNVAGNGDVMVAGVKAPGSGYTGPYFKTIPMTLEAVPKPGWKFVKWQETGETNPLITVTLTGNLTRTAVFEEVGLPDIVINEINYNPAGTDDLYEFVELYNNGSSAVPLGGYYLTGVTFTFPAGTSIAAGEHIIVAKTAATYQGQGYQVFQYSGGLSNGGELVALYDSAATEIDAVTYSSSAPWPIGPNDLGPSLSLIAPSLNNSLPESWAASHVNGGSPGAANPATPPTPASMTIIKEVVGGVPASDWAFTGGLGAFTLPAAGGQQTFNNLTPGNFTVTETAVSGYTAAVSCTNGMSGSSSVTVNLASGANVTCTFVNTQTQPATLTIVKQVVGDIPTGDWAFTGGLGVFSLPAVGGQQTFNNLTPGSFTVTETTVSGYTAAVSCTTGDSGTSSVIVNLTPGANVTCTFVNTQAQPATLTIVKQVVGAAPASDWAFTGGLGAFSLPAAGGQQTFNNLTPGSFTITEATVSGYTASLSCTNGMSGTSSVTVNLAAGDNVTCTFVNTKFDTPPVGHCNPPVPGNLILNPGFESQKANWSFFTNGSGTFTIATTSPYECASYARVAITTTGSNVQLFQNNFTLLSNTTYSLRLAARSPGGRDAKVLIHRDSSPYTNYGLSSATLNLTPEWQVFQLEFTTTGFTTQTGDTRLRIWLAPYDVNGSIFEFDDVVLVKK